jgi:hypothetical protein
VEDTVDKEAVDIADKQAEHTVDANMDADVVEDVVEDVDRLRRRHKTTPYHKSADRLHHYSVEERAYSMRRTP